VVKHRASVSINQGVLGLVFVELHFPELGKFVHQGRSAIIGVFVSLLTKLNLFTQTHWEILNGILSILPKQFVLGNCIGKINHNISQFLIFSAKSAKI